jgi:hypothetical protein
MNQKKARNLRFQPTKNQALLNILNQTERDVIEITEKYWEELHAEDDFQEQVLHLTHTIRRAKTVLHVIGSLPKSIH